MKASCRTEKRKVGATVPLAAILFVASACSVGGDDAVTCSTDSDCRGARVCMSGTCRSGAYVSTDGGTVNPSGGSGGGSSGAGGSTPDAAPADTGTGGGADALEDSAGGTGGTAGSGGEDASADADPESSVGGTGGTAGFGGEEAGTDADPDTSTGGTAGSAGSGGEDAGTDAEPEASTGGTGGSGGSGGSGGTGGTGGLGGSGGTGGSGGVTNCYEASGSPKCPTAGADGSYCVINAGSFDMGSPATELGRSPSEQSHTVALTHRFLVGATEVTQRMWSCVVGTAPSAFGSCGPNCPVESVTWFSATVYANRLSQLAGLETCYADPDDGTVYDQADASGEKTPRWTLGPACLGYRLPTEAEWEYAARAGTKTAFFTGAITVLDCSPLDPKLDLAGWYCGNASSRSSVYKLKKENAWGLYDTHGNVWEWTWDTLSDLPSTKVTDPLGGPEDAYIRVTKGGSFYEGPGLCRSAARSGVFPISGMEAIGFRIVRTYPTP